MATTDNNIHIPDDLLAQAEKLATSQGRTADDLAADALKRYPTGRRPLLCSARTMYRILQQEGESGERRWFAGGGAGPPDDYESLSAPLSGRMSRGLQRMSSEYSVLELIDGL